MRRDCAPCCCMLIEVESSAREFMVVAMILRSCKYTSDQELQIRQNSATTRLCAAPLQFVGPVQLDLTRQRNRSTRCKRSNTSGI